MNGGQQNQSGYSSGFYGSSPLQRQNQDMYGNSFGSGSMYSMHQPHGGFGSQMQDSSPIKISPTVLDTSIEPFSIRQKMDNGIQCISNCITSMERYSPYSLEELRCADYKKGRKGTIVARQSGYHSTYGSPTSYMQKPSDLMGGIFGQKKPETTSSFASLAQSGYSSQQRPPAQSIFSSSPQSTSMFGQSQNSSFIQNQNSSFLGQQPNSSFQQPQTSSMGSFGSFGQPAGGMQSQGQQTPSIFSSPSSTQQNMSSAFSNNANILGSNTSMAQQSPSLGISSFGGLGGMSSTNSQSTLGMLGVGAQTPRPPSAFSLGGSTGSSSAFSLQPQSALGTGLSTQSQTSSPFSQLGAQTAGSNTPSFGGLGSSSGLGQAAGSNALGSGGFGGQQMGSTQTQLGGSQQLGSGFGFSSGQSALQPAGASGILGGLGNKPAEPLSSSAPSAFSFGASSSAQDAAKTGFGGGLGLSLSKPLESSSLDANKTSSPFGSSFGSGISSLGGGLGAGSLQTQPTSSFGVGGALGSSALLGESKTASASASSSNDPYLIKSLDFKECEEYQKKTVMEIPAPLFKKTATPKIKFKAMGSFKEFVSMKGKEKEKRNETYLEEIEENEYYTIPSIAQIKKMQNRKISGFVIGRKNHGRVEFQEEVDLNNIDLDSITSMVNIEDSYIFFSYDEERMPPGQGINKAIRVILENVIPYSHSTGSMKTLTESDPCFINIQSRVIANLPKGAAIESANFNPATGVITIYCPHLWTDS
ncbi:hypothetical protein NEMIN01_1823 [Nematocida minor]|uniref:uncharacterized protein n=1 Tax=Nematocida minor TaxID=1912983 RepID=UPI002220B56C|nr:uncharacterized protein NEMIN01_1823 [Nematocida minor]KAI5192127.1 hypothetical protein NEMIN01_1823 [Nematocida minor]